MVVGFPEFSVFSEITGIVAQQWVNLELYQRLLAIQGIWGSRVFGDQRHKKKCQ
ncbi:MAG: hypothetical protein H7Y28_04715 [Rhodoferax sp.]|nr:hypothetical protein [Rhodoferax sp.]